MDWATLSTAYGPATDVPRLLANLRSDDPTDRAAAISDLWSGLCHQGTVYTASPVAAPILLDATREAPLSSSERQQLLALVAAIGRGEDTCWRGYTPWEVVKDCAAAVEALVPGVIAWADAGSTEARTWAVVLAVYFPERFRTLGRDVGELLTSQHPDLIRLVHELVDEEEPDASLVAGAAACDEDTEDYLVNALEEMSPTRQGRHVVWNLAERERL